MSGEIQEAPLRDFLCKINELESRCRIAEYEMQAEREKENEHRKQCIQLEKEIKDMEVEMELLESKKLAADKANEASEDAGAALETAILNETAAYQSLKSEFDEILMNKKQNIAIRNKSMFNKRVAAEEILAEDNLKGSLDLESSIDTDAVAGVDHIISKEHAATDSSISSLLSSEDSLKSLFCTGDCKDTQETNLRKLYATMRQAKQSIDVRGDKFDEAAVKFHAQMCDSFEEANNMDPISLQLELIEYILRADRMDINNKEISSSSSTSTSSSSLSSPLSSSLSSSSPSSSQLSPEEKIQILKKIFDNNTDWIFDAKEEIVGFAGMQKNYEIKNEEPKQLTEAV